MLKTLFIKIENSPGALSRVIGLFSQRGYNIESLNVSPTHKSSVSHIIIKTLENEISIIKIAQQLKKLIDVIQVKIINNKNYIERKLILLQLHVKTKNIKKILSIIIFLKSEIIKFDNNTFIIGMLGSNKKIKSFINIIKKMGKINKISTSEIIRISKT
ncbi:acetolactate synthase small subunit [Buchnera aphidicola]|uniref:acetolactate synthase small subunit n=1 Tax=Buchnera aphidicola TaxID=9 RepID=UPI0030EBD18A